MGFYNCMSNFIGSRESGDIVIVLSAAYIGFYINNRGIILSYYIHYVV